MVNLAAHAFPTIAVLLLWFGGTALIVWAANRPRETYRRSLTIGGAIGSAGLLAVAVAAPFATIGAVYLSFCGALTVWGWQELAFLTGAVTGPRRTEAEQGATGWRRFSRAAATLIHHELALAATLALLVLVSWDAPNQTGALTFALLFVLRLSAKLNLYLGVPNFSDELLPAHLRYLVTYFGSSRLGPWLIVSLAANAGLAAWLAARAAAAPDGAAFTAAGLLFALAALGVLEHLFLALPFRDGALWRWANPAFTGKKTKGGGYGL